MEFDSETEKDFQKWIKQFEKFEDVDKKDDEWYNGMRIIFWNINNG